MKAVEATDVSFGYLGGVGQLGTVRCNDLLQLEEEPLPEATKVPRHGRSGVQLQASTYSLSNCVSSSKPHNCNRFRGMN